jgi:hypothetical protein
MTFKESPSSQPLTLETVKAQLDRWRATRVKGNRMPKHLWEAVSGLTKQYAYSLIASELKINPHRLRAKIEKQSRQASSLSKIDFIEIPLSPLTSPFAHPPSSKPNTFDSHAHAAGILEVTRPDGIALKVSGLSHNDLCSLIKSFLGH